MHLSSPRVLAEFPLPPFDAFKNHLRSILRQRKHKRAEMLAEPLCSGLGAKHKPPDKSCLRRESHRNKDVNQKDS